MSAGFFAQLHILSRPIALIFLGHIVNDIPRSIYIYIGYRLRLEKQNMHAYPSAHAWAVPVPPPSTTGAARHPRFTCLPGKLRLRRRWIKAREGRTLRSRCTTFFLNTTPQFGSIKERPLPKTYFGEKYICYRIKNPMA